APLAPEVASAIVEHILRPSIGACEFEPSVAAIAALWDRMYAAMRVRGQTGGFMLDAISGVDLALWDLAGQCTGMSVGSMLGGALEKRNVRFLECPFPPEEIDWHIRLRETTPIPLALGESYRTRYELRRLLESGAVAYLQPDLGRCGITEGLRIAALAREHG